MECPLCEDSGWVCENHPKRAWEGEQACGCRGAGAPCPVRTVPEPGEGPRLPEGFNTDMDKDGWRH
jgi:hypothetical protein